MRFIKVLTLKGWVTTCPVVQMENFGDAGS